MKKNITEKKFDSTFDEPQSTQAINFQDKFDKTMAIHGINLSEVDKQLNEKEQSLKKKIFSLPKMEALVFSDPKLTAVYDDMAEDGEEKYGYHYNETIMNIIFNDYVLNSSKYLQKYKKAIPKKKKRRDKSGIDALRKDSKDIEKREKELKKDKEKGNKSESINETSGAAKAGSYVTKANDKESHEANQIDTEKEWENLNDPDEAEIGKETKMKDKKKKKSKPKPVDKTNFVGGSSAKPTWKGGKVIKNGNNTTLNESDMNNLENLKQKAQKISKEEGVAQHVNKISDDNYEISNWYDDDRTIISYENGEELSETTTAASSGAYVGPAMWGSGDLMNTGKEKEKDKEPYWKGGEMIKESNYLTNPNGFEKYFKFLNENELSVSEIKKELEGTEIRSLEHEGMVYVENGTAYSADNQQPLNLDDQGWKNLYNEYFENEFGAHPDTIKNDKGTYDWDQLVSMGLIENNDMNEHHLETRDQKIKFIVNNMEGAIPLEVLNDMSDDDINTLYQQIESEMELSENQKRDDIVGFDKIMSQLNTMGGFDYDLFNEVCEKNNIDGVTLINMIANERKKQSSKASLNEKSKSKSQQQAAGMALAAKRGEMDVDDLKGAAKDMYDSMSEDDLEDFAETKHKGLPKHVDENDDEAYDKLMEKENIISKIIDLEKEMYPEEYDDKYDVRDRSDRLSMLDIDKIKSIYNKVQQEYNSNKNMNEHHLSDKNDIQKFIKKAYTLVTGTQAPENKLNDYLNNTEYEKLYDLYLRFENKLREKDIDPTTIDINEKNKLDEHHLKNREEKLNFIKKVSPFLMDDSMVDNYINILKNASDDEIHHAYLKAEQILKTKGYDPKKITETMIDNQEDSMKLDPNPINVDAGSDMPKGMQSGGSMGESKKNKDIMKESNEHLEKLNKDLKLIEMHQNKLEEDRKTSSLVMKDRYGKENEKNFKQDLKHSGTKEIIDTTKELEWKDQQTEVGKDPQKLGKDIEKQHLKNTKGDSFENEGNSTNNDGNEIPKRNLTDDEADEVDLYRKGLGDFVYDNEPDERYMERMKRDMGEKNFKKRQDKLDFQAQAPMYNKDSTPVDDGIEKVQYDKDKSKWNSRMGIKESTLTGKFTDEMGKTRVFDFSTLNVQEINDLKNMKNGAFFKMDMTGLGNSYDKKGQILENVTTAINEWEFYTDGNKNVFAYKPVKKLNENKETKDKKVVNEEFTKMKHLLNYQPKDFINTKKNKI
jgi:hypothetical protein